MIEHPSSPPIIPRRFRWRRFWTAFALALTTYVSLAAWADYQQKQWDMRAQSFLSTVASLSSFDSQAVISRIGQPVSSTQNGSELVLEYGPPNYPLGLKLHFVNGCFSRQTWSTLASRGAHSIGPFLDGLGMIALAVCLPLWLVLAIGACFHHRYERPLSHLLLAAACILLVAGVSITPLNPAAWFFGLVLVAVSAVAIGSTRRIPQGDATPACQECGYNLTGNISGICPECGMTVPQELRETSAGEARP
jgi:hypothetical protein